ncbi:MAG: GNAT family N-acetyltransferase [Defluviitaleaceae bacterium]|nr:GNAT family N-acetyltransferase [Defluviitaleaceae bacterium]
MDIELKQLLPSDDVDIYEMLQELPKDENGFINGCNGKSYDEYKNWLIKSDNIANGIGLEDWMVPQNIYWLYVDGKPVGMGKLRHYLTDKLKEEGGHGGYAVRPSCRQKGYGSLLLKLMIEKARNIGTDKLLITVQNDNAASIKVALANNGIITKTDDIRHYIWIDV